MSGWHDTQHEVQLTILCLLLLVLNPALTMASKVAPNLQQSKSHVGKRIPENGQIDIHLLYNAYRERVKEGNDESRYSPRLTCDNSAVAVAEESGMDSMKNMEEDSRNDLTEKYNKVIEGFKTVSEMPIKLNANNQCIEQQNTFVKQDFKAPESQGHEQNPKTDAVKINPKIKSTVILKMDLPSTMNVESVNLKAQSNSRDSPEQRVAELNRVFKEFVNVWKKPTADPAHPYLFGSPNTDYASKPVHLNALNDLMNVVENLKQPDTMDNFVKAINDEMMRDTDIVSFPNCLSFVDNLEKRSQNQNVDESSQNQGLKDSHVKSSQEYEDAEVKSENLVSTNKLTSNDNPGKTVITEQHEQPSRISKRVATDPKSVNKNSSVAKSAKTGSSEDRCTETKSVKEKSTGEKSAEARSTKPISSDAKSSEAKYSQENTSDSKVAGANSIVAKALKKSADVNVVEAKPVSAECGKTKSNEEKSDEVKPVEVKPAEQKSADAKIADSNSAAAKSTDAKSAEAKLVEVKNAEVKGTEAKCGDSKSSDARFGDTPQIQSGGLYEEYKHKLQEILAANHNQRKFVSNGENIGKADSQCHCDERRTLTLAVGPDGATMSNSPVQCHCEASKHPTYADGIPAKLSNSPVACHCDSHTCSALDFVGIIHPKVVANKVLFAQKKKEGVNDQGPKPYYISNSKQRQMVWNDIPLSGEKSHFDNAIKKPDSIKYLQNNRAQPADDLKPNLEPPSQKNRPDSQSKKHTQLQYLVRVLQDKHRSPMVVRRSKKRNLYRRSNAKNHLAALLRRAKKRDLLGGLDANNRLTNQPSFPQVFVNQPVQAQPNANSGRMIGMMAKQLNVSPMEMVQRIASSTNADAAPMIDNPVPFYSASQTNGFQVPNDSAYIKPAPEITLNSQANQANLGPVLDKILTRLQTIQDYNFHRDLEDWNSQGVPCCFAEPSDGSPCDLVGSWESVLLGVRINIKDETKPQTAAKKPLCYRPGWHSGKSKRKKRQCVKLSPEEMKNRYNAGQTMQLNVTLEETVPPREHTMIDNISNWVVTAHTVSTLGGPITFSCRKMNSKIMATFVGFCRNCGCIDTIFGSWSFIHPSRDCQDITMSILERRDILRRYSLVEARRERFKEQLYRKSGWAKAEKEQEQPINQKKRTLVAYNLLVFVAFIYFVIYIYVEF